MLVGQTLAGYRIDAVAGMGGMGVVYRATQMSLGRPVALKVLSPTLVGNRDFRERFRREGRHAAALDHPNIIPVFESGERDGLMFIAMRFVDGPTLGDLIAKNCLSARETLRIAGAIASALDAAHAAGLVHRDVKPQNIILTASGHPYLADFGITKTMGGGLTRQDGFVGSVAYASPEQIEGREVTGASDVYALCAVLYECLSGRYAFERDTEVALMHAHLHSPAPTLSERGIDAPAGLDRVFETGMAKEPGARHPSASALVEDCRRALADLDDARLDAAPAFTAAGATGQRAPARRASSPTVVDPQLMSVHSVTTAGPPTRTTRLRGAEKRRARWRRRARPADRSASPPERVDRRPTTDPGQAPVSSLSEVTEPPALPGEGHQARRLTLSLEVELAAGATRDVTVIAERDAPVVAVITSLAAHCGVAGGHMSLYCDRLGRALNPDGRFAACGLCDGDRIRIDVGSAQELVGRLGPTPGPCTELVVTGGPRAGLRRQLAAGSYLLGRDPGCDIHIDDPNLSTSHLGITVDRRQVAVEDAGSANGVTVDGVHVPAGITCAVVQGASIHVGRTVVSFRAPLPSMGRVPFSRPPRLGRVEVPESAPVRLSPVEQRRRIPTPTALIPLVIGLAMFAWLGEPFLLVFVALSPLILIASAVFDRAAIASELRRRRAEIERIGEERRAAEREARLSAAPDVEELVRRTTMIEPTLWERRPHDRDFLDVRVGCADQPPRTTLEVAPSGHRYIDSRIAAVAQARPSLPAVPAVVPLRRAGMIGIVGSADPLEELPRWMLGQLAALHSPLDLLICAAVDAEFHEEWDWLKWLPHTRPAAPVIDAPLLAGDPDAGKRLIEAVAEVAEERTSMRNQVPPSPVLPHIVLLLDRAAAKEQVLIDRIAACGQDSAVTIIARATGRGEFRARCDYIVEVAPQTDLLLVSDREGRTTVGDVTPDIFPLTSAKVIAHALAPVQDSSAGATIPRSVGLLTVLDMVTPDGAGIRRRWARSPRGLTVAVGAGENGFVEFDLNADGPHMLVTGAAGAGKSEFLRSVIGGLAATYAPDHVSFLLMSEAEPSTFDECASMPHVVGVIETMDSYAAQRVITSLATELRRRQVTLQRFGAKSFAELATAHRSDAPPSLVMVVDEFASFAQSAPRFVESLVDIAQRGRSLGVHLILATRHAARAVDDVIRVNTNIRVALRADSVAESIDMIGSADAAFVPRRLPGRAWARIGPLEPFEFQVAYSAMKEAAARDSDPGPSVRDFTWDALTSAGGIEEPDGGAGAPTHLSTLQEGVREATPDRNGRTERLPVLPPLSNVYVLEDLPVPEPGATVAGVTIGVEDLPAEQLQREAVFDLAHQGHLVAVGAPRSGRSELLRTIAAAIARQYVCGDVHIYAIDCGGGSLRALRHLPHVGAVLTRTETEAATRLLGRLSSEVRGRQGLLAEGGFSSIDDQRAAAGADQRIPHIVLLIDAYERFEQTLGQAHGGHLRDQLVTLMREGPPAGIHVVIAGGPELLDGRMPALADQNLVLRMDDPADYRRAGLRPESIPITFGPGRAIRVESGAELQIARLERQLEDFASAVRRRDDAVAQSRRPFRVGEQLTYVSDRFHTGDAQGRPVGREDVLAWLRDRDGTGTSAALLGPRRAGKTWVLAELARRLKEDGATSVQLITVPHLPPSSVETPDELATLLDPGLASADSPAQTLRQAAEEHKGTSRRRVFLLDEVGRLAGYGPVAVSWLRDLGQAGATLVYTGTEKDWNEVIRLALLAPGSSFGNDVNARVLGPLEPRAAVTFLEGTALNLGVTLKPGVTSAMIIRLVGTWPFYLQVVGDALIKAVNANDSAVLEHEPRLRALVEERLLDEWTHNFLARWAEIGPAGRAALLDNPGEPLRSLTPAQRSDLREVGLLRPGDGWLEDPPMFEWIARHAASLRDEEHLG